MSGYSPEPAGDSGCPPPRLGVQVCVCSVVSLYRNGGATKTAHLLLNYHGFVHGFFEVSKEMEHVWRFNSLNYCELRGEETDHRRSRTSQLRVVTGI